MGDYASPKPRDLYDRLRRRFEVYRRRHGNISGRFDRLASGLHEHQRQETLLLQQRWLETKAKKASKGSKSNNNNNNNNNNNSGGTTNSGSKQTDQTNTQVAVSIHDNKTGSSDRASALVVPYLLSEFSGFLMEVLPTFVPNFFRCFNYVHSILFLQKRRKTDHDHNQGATVDHIYNFDENDDHSSQTGNKKVNLNACLHSQVSVNIIQQINSQGDQDGNQTSKIKLTVSSTIHTGNNNSTSAPSSESNINQTSTIQTNGNICKQEPQDTSDSTHKGPTSASAASNSSQASFPDFVDDELEAFLNQLSPGVFQDLMYNDGAPSQETVDSNSKNLVNPKYTEQQTTTVVQSTQQQQVTLAATNSSHNSGECKKGGSNVGRERKDSHPSTLGGMFGESVNTAGSPNGQNFTNMGGQGAMPMPGYPRPQSGPPGPGTSPGVGQVPTLLGDTGPAAETLRQMAAQHQPEYEPMKGPMPSHLTENLLDGYPRRPGPFSPYMYNMGNGPQVPNMYPYGSPNGNQGPVSNMARTDSQQAPNFPGKNVPKLEPGLNSGATKPLSHFPDSAVSSAPSSSLQQLQNQVHAQFSQAGVSTGQSSYPTDGAQMHIKQSQHMQVTSSAGNNAGSTQQTVNMSQSQQMQIHTGPGGPRPQHISLAQQQSFSMSQGSTIRPQTHKGGPYMGPQEDMKMPSGMYPQQGPDKLALVNQQPMRQYMGSAPSHPPPEYKPPAGGASMANFVGSNGPNMQESSNPLQTMQNMVNQTPQSASSTPGSTGQDMMYHQRMIKTEMGPGHGGQMIPHPQMVGMNHIDENTMQSSGSGAPTVSGVGPRPAPPYSMSQQNMPNGTGSSKSSKQSTSSYTSAIMRGQRPPNVNVGPEGLNISHQRNPADWPRPMMAPHHHHPGMAMPVTNYPTGMRPNMGPQGMMQYPGSYPTSGYHANMNMPGGGMEGHHMQMSQQQAMAVAHHQCMPHPQQRHMMPGGGGGGGMVGPRMGPPAQVPHGPHIQPGNSPMPPGMHMAQQQHMSMQHHNGQPMGMNQPGPMLSPVTSHPNIPPSQMHTPAQGPPSSQGVGTGPGPQGHPGQGHPGGQNPAFSGPQGHPMPHPVSQGPQSVRTNPSGPEFALDFLDNPASGNTDLFDSTNPSDFNNFIDDILGNGK
ncbi:hypothetical protein LSH36_41g13152 [Paralvinella palmiformis]|uniref:Neurogenic mastermind-like N-terminal domain-containing protein n=1 Tax=Paralvinella palmiformis TaxID=53620 RepID=A0AAD9K784_9ANNE|nr:hypothetical protein LSH36_41g13152 [Paralvinella palmiformis]